MAKKEDFTEVFPDTKAIFDTVISNANLNHKIMFAISANNKLKTIGELKKYSPLFQFRTDIDVELVLNEIIFEQLPVELKSMVIEELICPVYVNPETGSVTLEKPDFNSYSGFMEKYSYETIRVMKESIKSLFTKQAEEEQKKKDAQTKIKMNKK